MQRTHIYLPEELAREINYIAKIEGKTKAEVTRLVIKAGIKVIKPQKSKSAKALLDIAKEARKLIGTGPRDLSINLDHYVWGGPKRDPNAQV